VILVEDPSQNVVIDVERGYSQPFVELLERTIWGTRGLRYRGFGFDHSLDRIPDFRTIRLWVEGQMVGAYGLSFKTVYIGQTSLQAYHRMFLAIEGGHRGRGLGRLLAEHTRRHFLLEAKEPVVLYGYIEDTNSRSLSISHKVGYRSIGTFTSTLFSRLRPRDRPDVSKLDDVPGMRALLMDQYRDHALVDLHDSLLPDEYWVLTRHGDVIAGVQASPRKWSLDALPGLSGWLLLRSLPRVPVLRRLLRNRHFDYCSMANLYVKEGHEADFFILCEAVLARLNQVAAMAFGDNTCPVFNRLKGAGSFGALASMGLESQVHVMTGSRHVSDSVVAEAHRRPLLISPLDPS
jgi:hypothetical protein